MTTKKKTDEPAATDTARPGKGDAYRDAVTERPHFDRGEAEKTENIAPVDKIDPNPVEATEPYPTGTPRDPEEDFKAAHGYRRDEPKKET